MASDGPVRAALRAVWHCASTHLEPLPPGRDGWPADDGLRSWAVYAPSGPFIATVSPDRHGFAAGLYAAEWVLDRGVLVAAPVRTADGAVTVAVPGGSLALLRPVRGRPLIAGDPVDQQWWGGQLGAVHRAADGFTHPGVRPWHWLRPAGAHLSVEPWVRPRVAAAVAAMTRLAVTDQLTYGVLHGDPAPGVFRLDPDTGRTGVTGWGRATVGPLVYDLACAVRYAGGPAAATELLDGYAAAGPVPRDEIDAALPVLLRFRAAAQLDACARRLYESPPGTDLAAARATLESHRTALAAS